MAIKGKLVLLASVTAAALLMVACGQKQSATKESGSTKNISVALVTDGGGVDDKSFNQSAWEGMEAFGKANNLKKGANGYNYAQSNSDADFVPNINKLIQAKFQTIYGIGYKIKAALQNAAKQNPNTNFVLIDDVVPAKNVASVTFKDNEAAYLAGVAAASTTKSKKLGFVGGQHSAVIDRFEAGFKEGVRSVDPSIKVDAQYVDSYTKPDVGQALANAMYNSGVDIIYHAAGGSGNGVFSAAKNQIAKKQVWVIGVDRDQTAEGKYADGNLTLTSTVKGVNVAVEKMATLAKDGKFPGGKTTVYGLKDNGVSLVKGQLSDAAWKAVNAAKQQIVAGKLTVAEKPADVK